MFKMFSDLFSMLQRLIAGTDKYIEVYEKSGEMALQKMDHLIAEQAREAEFLIAQGKQSKTKPKTVPRNKAA